jgi:MerR family transcriptional regulator, light-induced transcriptional regulator
MNSFTIRDIENLSGIKAHTLRIWEQRYGIISPGRRESNHRRYNTEDLKHILRISYLYHQGYKISRISKMSVEEIKKLALEYSNKSSYEVFINQMMEASIDFDKDAFEQVFTGLFTHMGLEKSMIHVIYPFLNKIGLLWMTGNIIPAQEHFASNIIRNKIFLAINDLQKAEGLSEKKIILFGPPGEFHEIPLLLVQYLLKRRGISYVFFGVNTSLEFIREYLRNHKATHVFYHLITNFTCKDPVQYLEELCKELPGVTIVASGPAYRDEKTEVAGAIILRNMGNMLDFING